MRLHGWAHFFSSSSQWVEILYEVAFLAVGLPTVATKKLWTTSLVLTVYNLWNIGIFHLVSGLLYYTFSKLNSPKKIRMLVQREVQFFVLHSECYVSERMLFPCSTDIIIFFWNSLSYINEDPTKQ